MVILKVNIKRSPCILSLTPSNTCRGEAIPYFIVQGEKTEQEAMSVYIAITHTYMLNSFLDHLVWTAFLFSTKEQTYSCMP